MMVRPRSRRSSNTSTPPSCLSNRLRQQRQIDKKGTAHGRGSQRSATRIHPTDVHHVQSARCTCCANMVKGNGYNPSIPAILLRLGVCSDDPLRGMPFIHIDAILPTLTLRHDARGRGQEEHAIGAPTSQVGDARQRRALAGQDSDSTQRRRRRPVKGLLPALRRRTGRLTGHVKIAGKSAPTFGGDGDSWRRCVGTTRRVVTIFWKRCVI